MSLKTSLAVALLGVLTLAAEPAGAQAPPPAPVPAPAPRAAHLDAIVEFFVPAARLSELMIDGTTVAYRTRINSNDDYRTLEAAYPGILDAMVAAAAEAVRAAAPERIARLQDEVRGYWNARLSDTDAAAMGVFASHPSVTNATRTGIAFQPGDTATAGVERSRDALDRAHIFEQFEQHQAAFARTPAGQRLLPMMTAYQSAFRAQANAAGGAVARLMLAAAHRAANDFVGRHYPGRDLPYADPPSPG